MPSLRPLSLLVPLLLLATTGRAETRAFSVASSDSLGEDNAALVLEAGWPVVGAEYIMGLNDFFDLAVRIDYEYTKAIRIGPRVMLQFVDVDRIFDLGLAVEPMFGVIFGDSRTTFEVSGGVLAGVRPIPILTLFVQLWHRSHVEFVGGQHRHGPRIEAGLEVGVGADINLIAFGRVNAYWVDHGPEFSGGLGVAFGLF